MTAGDQEIDDEIDTRKYFGEGVVMAQQSRLEKHGQSRWLGRASRRACRHSGQRGVERQQLGFLTVRGAGVHVARSKGARPLVAKECAGGDGSRCPVDAGARWLGLELCSLASYETVTEDRSSAGASGMK